MPSCPDLAIFVLTTDDRQAHKPIALPLAAHARTRGNEHPVKHSTLTCL
jgi:hypothetical protein